jgi:murein DD-endopeptidase MepM/ murein hydrolase activator NlpD
MPFIWPVTGRISGVYGSQRILNGKPKRPHYGVDIAAPTGTPVKAPADGVVSLVHNDMFYSGGTLIVDHGHGLSTTYMHLHKILVKKGQRVKQGDVIAQVGATGRVTGPHLHWGMNWFDTRLDPSLLVPPMPKPAATSDQ